MTGTVLITGGLGYLGGRIASQLRDQDRHVRLSTRRRGPYPDWTTGLEIVRGEFADSADQADLLDGADAVIHLAAMNARDCAADPDLARRVNVDSAGTLAAAAHDRGIGRFVYMSTAHVYAAPLVGRIDETTPTTNAHPYATTHLEAERRILESLPSALVFRLSNGFGVPQDAAADCWMLLVNDLCRQVAVEGAVTLRGAGRDPRDFVTLDTVARAVAFALDADLGGQVLNLGSGRPRTVLDMAETIRDRAQRLTGRRLDLHVKPPRPGEIAQDLDFRIDRLQAAGFRFDEDPIAEIDATLAFCQTNFGNTGWET